MKKIPYSRLISCLVLVLCCVLAAGCGQYEPAQTPFEQADAYRQMALYIQEGFRTYDVEGTYQAYFGKIWSYNTSYSCDILLEGENEWWEEGIYGSYDAESGWYTFQGDYEPILLENAGEVDRLRKDSDFATKMRENYVYSTQISKDQNIASDIHYHSGNGPIERDFQKEMPATERYARTYSYVWPYLYSYYDDRMDIDITIEYPQIYLDDKTLEKQINEKLRNAFFYSYDYDEEGSLLKPREHMYTEIARNYIITRQDETYFSMRIFEYNDYRAANHPNEFETGITINMKTGEVLGLQDVIGENWTPVSLLETGALHCLLGEGENDEEAGSESLTQNALDQWERHERYATLEELDRDMKSCFYVTPDGLGLITNLVHMSVPMEATFEELGVEGL